jgi:hypothetical protein
MGELCDRALGLDMLANDGQPLMTLIDELTQPV